MYPRTVQMRFRNACMRYFTIEVRNQSNLNSITLMLFSQIQGLLWLYLQMFRVLLYQVQPCLLKLTQIFEHAYSATKCRPILVALTDVHNQDYYYKHQIKEMLAIYHQTLRRFPEDLHSLVFHTLIIEANFFFSIYLVTNRLLISRIFQGPNRTIMLSLS